MNIKKAFPSQFLKAAELDGDVVLTIKEVHMEDIGTDSTEQKPVVKFEETEQKLVLNRTNSNVISGLYGDDTDDWTGKRITVFPDETDFGGKRVPCIRVRLRAPSAGRSVSPNTGSLKAAWEAFQATQSGESKEEIATSWKKAVQNYFGTKPKEAIKPEEWKRFIDDDFQKVAVPAIPEERLIPDDDIPF